MTNNFMAPWYTPSHTMKSMVVQYVEEKRRSKETRRRQEEEEVEEEPAQQAPVAAGPGAESN